MSALARYFKREGKNVAGYDLNETTLTKNLSNEGISIHYTDDITKISKEFLNSNETLIVFTPAIPSSHRELNWFKENNFNIIKRAEALGIITAENTSVAIGGTHGKTTTSSLTAHLLLQSDVKCHAFLGGIAVNLNSNFIYSANTNIAVVEADEYDRSFLKLSPSVVVITSMDADHLEIYGDKDEMNATYQEFANKTKDILIYKKGLSLKSDKKTFTYSIHEKADVYATNIRIENGNYCYDICSPFGNLENVILGLPGRHNIENSLAAVTVAQYYKINNDEIKNALASFKGVKRRFETIIKNDKLVYIDDYAHHPEELKACIGSAKELYAGKKLTGIFQPHLYSRTKDFADEFASSLDLLDETLLLEIYPARELPMEGVTSQLLIDKMKSKNKKIVTKENCIEYFTKNKPEVLLTMGAGDIDKLVQPLAEVLA